MDRLTTAASAGMRARMEALDLLANNLANASAPGYKADREFYSLYNPADADGRGVPMVDRAWTDFSQGSITPTGNPMDIALSGSGFLKVQSSTGPLYSRGGSLRLSAGGVLQTSEGYTVEKKGGGPIRLDATAPVEITADGTVRQRGEAVAQLELVDLDKPEHISKRSGLYLQWLGTTAPPAARGTEVMQGRIEGSNAGPAETAVRLIHVMRQFESLQRALTLSGEMGRRSIEEAGKVSG